MTMSKTMTHRQLELKLNELESHRDETNWNYRCYKKDERSCPFCTRIFFLGNYSFLTITSFGLYSKFKTMKVI